MDLLGWLLATRSDHRALMRELETVHVTVNRVLAVTHRLEAAMAVTQEQVDALTASVQEASTRIGEGVNRANTSLDAVRADMQAVKDAHPDVDLSSLESSVGNLSDAVAPLSTLADNLAELDSENPELPPAEPTDPTSPSDPTEPPVDTPTDPPVDAPVDPAPPVEDTPVDTSTNPSDGTGVQDPSV